MNTNTDVTIQELNRQVDRLESRLEKQVNYFDWFWVLLVSTIMLFVLSVVCLLFIYDLLHR